MNDIYSDFAEFSKDIRSFISNNDYKYNIEYENKIPILKILNKDNELCFKFNEFKTMDIINEYINLIDRIIKDQKDYRFVCDLKDNDVGIPIDICQCYIRIVPIYELIKNDRFRLLDFHSYKIYCEVIKECECHPNTFGELFESRMSPYLEPLFTIDRYMYDCEIIEYLYTAESKYKIIETGDFRRPKWREYYIDDKGKILLMSYEFEEYNSKQYKIVSIVEK